MSDPNRVSLLSPHPRSYFAFLKRAEELLQLEEGVTPNLYRPATAREVQSAFAQRYWARWATLHEVAETHIEQQAREILQPVLGAEFRSRADNPSVEQVVEIIREWLRQHMADAFDTSAACTSQVYAQHPIAPAHALVFQVRSRFSCSQPDLSSNSLNVMTAHYLSKGIPTRDINSQFERDHVYRACKAFLRGLLGRVNSSDTKTGRERILLAHHEYWNLRLGGLEALAAEAVERSDLRSRSGVELAEAISAQAGGMLGAFERALDMHREIGSSTARLNAQIAGWERAALTATLEGPKD